MQFTSEQIKKAKTAKSAEELLAMAKAENVEMTTEQATAIFDMLNKCGELSDKELSAVAGGSKGDPSPRYFVGDIVYSGDNAYYIRTPGSWNFEYGCFQHAVSHILPKGGFGAKHVITELDLDKYYHR